MTCDCGSEPVSHFFSCSGCTRKVHADCLENGPRSNLFEDVLFEFTCKLCSRNNTSVFKRLKLSWHMAVHLCLYDLHVRNPGQKYFKWQEISAHIGKNWKCLFGNERKRQSNISGTIAGVLSHNNGQIFQSGLKENKEQGWWKLRTIQPPNLDTEVKTVESKRRKRKAVDECAGLCENEVSDRQTAKWDSIDSKGFSHIEQDTVSQDSFNPLLDDSCDGDLDIETWDTDDFPDVSGQNDFGADSASFWGSDDIMSDFDSLLSSIPPGGTTPADSEAWESLVSSHCLKSADTSLDSWADSTVSAKQEPNSSEGAPCSAQDMSLAGIWRSSTHTDLSQGLGFTLDEQSIKEEPTDDAKPGYTSQDEEDAIAVTSVKLRRKPARGKATEDTTSEDRKMPPSKVVCMSVYEEQKLLQVLEEARGVVDSDLEARQLRCKLRLREIKRQRGLPMFDPDAYVLKVPLQSSVNEQQSLKLPNKDNRQAETGSTYSSSSREHRLLDRFQLTSAKSCNSHHLLGVPFLNKLVGLEDHQLKKIKSPYTGRLLKPFIWRDYESRPIRLKLLMEIQAFAHRDEAAWQAPQPPPIDFAYIQPQHIPSINSLCREFFWPGVDMSECLQYPDFSCVVLYRKFVVGFAFMVPDSGYNETYISFLFTHPEWRGAGIGTFMIYHLIQTCMGKDVTLHVSASNPAMLLYQKFGFKPEEFILNFYEKYFPVDSKESRHAYFLRLRR